MDEGLKKLIDLKPGEKGIVMAVRGGWGLMRRVAELGLTPGTEVIMIRGAPFRGPVEVLVRGVVVALGRGVAVKILVKPIR
ncbi:ferrous iron transport protein A [Candidatus Geothermarchaeota archaeon]|nr:MAG: ferrous iron transport protein A [Candidatus Geothermarchaeota archaeon]